MIKILHEGTMKTFNGRPVREVVNFLSQVDKSLRFSDRYRNAEIFFGINEDVEEYFFYIKTDK